MTPVKADIDISDQTTEQAAQWLRTLQHSAGEVEMGIICGALLKAAILGALPLLLFACIFSIQPVLDETNSKSGEESAELLAFLDAWREAYPNARDANIIPLIPFLDEETSSGDLSVVRAMQLENGMLLIQEELRECISEHCFVYYGTRMVATWWPDICLVETKGQEAQDALRALASGHGVKVTLISDNNKAPPDFGMDGPRDSQLEFLRAQFTVGRLRCQVVAEGLTELHGAAAMGSPADIAALINVGADVNARTSGEENAGITPLHIAAQMGTPANIAALIEAGAAVGERDTEGETPLHFAARGGSPEAIAMLLEAGADVNARDDAGWASLHEAAWARRAAIVEALLDAGADGSVQDNYGRTPFDFANRDEGHEFSNTDAYTRLEKARHK